MIRNKLHEILDFVLDLNEQGKSHAFFDFSGHVEKVSVRFYKDGWTWENEPDLDMETYIDKLGSPERLEYIIKELKKLKEGKTDEKEN